MDLHTKAILDSIRSHSKIKDIVTVFCYCLIAFSFLVYVSQAFKQTTAVKLINDYKTNPKEYIIEKVMVNPRIKLLYNDSEIYDIKAKKAFYKDNSEVVLYDVIANGNIGNISAGELKINEEGDHLVFSKNPILILNKTE